MLTIQEEEILRTFRSIVNYQGEEASAISILSSNNWELEPAILQYVNNNTQYYQNLAQQASRTSLNRNMNNSTSVEDPQARSEISFITRARDWLNLTSSDQAQLSGSFLEDPPRASTSGVIMYYATRVITFVFILPLFIVYKLTPLLLSLVIHILQRLIRLKNRVSFLINKDSGAVSNQGVLFGNHSSKRVDPIDTARQFIDDFENDVVRILDVGGDIENAYSNVSKPNFFEGGYTQALYLAKRDAKWLLVYLQSDDHDDKDKFIKNILLSQRFNKFLSGNDIVLWGGNVKQSEGFQTANGLSCTRFPFLALLCLTTQTTTTTQGVSSGSPVLSVVSHIQGYHPLKKILVKFNQQIERFEPKLIEIRATLRERELSRLITEQQDLAYQSSLLKDQLKKQVKQLKQKNNKLVSQFVPFKLKQFAESSQIKKSLDRSVDSSEFYSRIAVRLPSGERMVTFFDRSLSVTDLYLYIQFQINGFFIKEINARPSEMLLINWEILKDYLSHLDTGEAYVPPSTYSDISESVDEDVAVSVYRVSFVLFSSFPKRELPFDDKQIGQIEFLVPDGNLIVEEKDDIDNGGDEADIEGQLGATIYGN
ncbi:Ubx3 protein [Saccharomycopsis crataegensis]|uniref:Ubx3 protein n=1 Tax=Saccharomycopsis crataegensis TaxID=43959 RepID=A0AAV5QH95_9ASCO|nr:Ubx3 protein [Saccharomycopsis crataegensis]